MKNKLTLEFIEHLKGLVNPKVIRINGIEVFNLLQNPPPDMDYAEFLSEVEKMEKFNYYPMIEKVTVDFNHTMHIVVDIYFSMQQIKKIIFVGEINH